MSHKPLTRTDIAVSSIISVLMHHNTVTNVDQICRWSVISFSLLIHRSYFITCLIVRFMLWLVCLEPVNTYWCGSIIKWRHHWTSVLSPLWQKKIMAPSYSPIIHLVGEALWNKKSFSRRHSQDIGIVEVWKPWTNNIQITKRSP